MSSSIDNLKKRREILTARIKLAQNREALKERKSDLRRKILVGAYYLEQAKKNNDFEELVKLMDDFLTRDSDRKVFGLKSISK